MIIGLAITLEPITIVAFILILGAEKGDPCAGPRASPAAARETQALDHDRPGKNARSPAIR
jgi:hypothetical protein